MKSALALLRALADPTRLRVLTLVRRMELSVGELAQVLGQSQPRVSRHIKIMADAGLLERHKEGAWVFVRLGAGAAVTAQLTALDAMNAGDALPADLARLDAVRAERLEASEAYFAAHAAEWDEIRSLHVADGQVEAAIEAALSGRPLGRLLDVGTGTGRIIELLAARASDAVGIDRSTEMLRVARGKLAALPNVQVRQADMYALPVADGAADTVVLHQVLHYAPDPAAAIMEAARTLAPGGRLLVVDFAPHDREELRTLHAHSRLGFEGSAVVGWMERAGLGARVDASLTGGPLTVTLWTGDRAPLEEMKAA
jgi:ArsR family transcriptional regulator